MLGFLIVIMLLQEVIIRGTAFAFICSVENHVQFMVVVILYVQLMERKELLDAYIHHVY